MTSTHNRRVILTSSAAVAGGAVAAAVTACSGDGGGTGGSGGGPYGDSGGNGGDGGDGGDAASPRSQAPAGERVAALSDVPVGGSTAVATPAGDALVSRKSETEVSAFSAVCTHQGCKVEPAGAELRCPCHGSVFDAFTGKVKNGPAEAPLPAIGVAVEGQSIVTT